MGDNTKMKLVEIGWAAWTEFLRLRTGEKTGCCENFNELSGPVSCGEFLG